MYKELIDTFISENKDNREALRAIENFIYECHRFVDHLRVSDQRERVGLSAADVKSIEKAYEKAKRYGFVLPADTDLSLAARTIRHDLFLARLKENIKKYRTDLEKLR